MALYISAISLAAIAYVPYKLSPVRTATYLLDEVLHAQYTDPDDRVRKKHAMMWMVVWIYRCVAIAVTVALIAWNYHSLNRANKDTTRSQPPPASVANPTGPPVRHHLRESGHTNRDHLRASDLDSFNIGSIGHANIHVGNRYRYYSTTTSDGLPFDDQEDILRECSRRRR
jgi:hypothetical protein